MLIINTPPDESDYPTPDRMVYVTIDDYTYTLRLLWNTRTELWYYSLTDEAGTTLISNQGLPANTYIFPRHSGGNYPTGMFYLLDTTGDSNVATLDSLGRQHYLVYYTSDEVSTISTFIRKSEPDSEYTIDVGA